jgi:hypothetical protein
MMVSDVFKTKQFAELGEGQQKFVRALTENGWNKLAAAREAFKYKNDASLRAQANAAWKNENVAFVLGLIDPNKAPIDQDEVEQILARIIRVSADPKVTLGGIGVLCKLKGWNGPKQPAEVPGEQDVYAQAKELEGKL